MPGFTGYEVSSDGRVRSLDRTVVDSVGRSRRLTGKMLKLKTDPSGYPLVTLGRPPLPCRYARVHVLMMEAFVGPRPPGLEVRHLDDVKSHNSLGNLTYGTHSENAKDIVRLGRHHESNKTHCPHGHKYSAKNTRPQHNGRGRTCISCARARAYVHNYGGDVREIADRYYMKLVS